MSLDFILALIFTACPSGLLLGIGVRCNLAGVSLQLSSLFKGWYLVSFLEIGNECRTIAALVL